MRRRLVPLLVGLVALALPAGALGHAERPSFFPDYKLGKVPQYRTSGPSKVVCKPDSRKRIRSRLSGRLKRRNLRLLDRCRFRHIQEAVDAAQNGDRILVLPGVYREEPSRAVPDPDPRCKDLYTQGGFDFETGITGGSAPAPTYEYHAKCPNSQNLIAVLGDSDDADRRCDHKCNLQIEGTGRYARHVVIEGAGYGHTNGSKLNLIRADRADGIYLRNFMVQYSDFNNIYTLETNGFVFAKIISRYSREYGVLSFTSDNGLYQRIAAYGSGDSGIYPGSGPEGRCERYGIEIRNTNSFGNTIGYSGTAGNGVYAHDNRFHDNATGMTTDSFASDHPGMPQDCAKWEDNQIYSNNLDLFNDERDAYCKETPVEKRDPQKVCPTFQVPVGTGVLIAGGNRNLVRNNFIYDNWRQGTALFWVPAAIRGEDDTGQSENNPLAQYDTSNGNRYEGNRMGVRPDGRALPNGIDHWWDEEGQGNCWSNNTGPDGRRARTDPANVPGCPQGSSFAPGDPAKQAFLVPCATWDPNENTDPPGCDWFERPPRP